MSDLIWKIRAPLTITARIKAEMTNRMRARTAKPRNIPVEFAHYTEPRAIGSFNVGQQLIAGEFYFAGDLIKASAKSIWSVRPPTADFSTEMHGFNWLDDLAAVGSNEARRLAQAWVMDWITRFGSGKGAGWTPELTGRRVLRICAHARFLLQDLGKPHVRVILRSLARQLNYLGKSWRSAAGGKPRLEALSGLIFAGVSFTGRERALAMANKAIGAEAARHIDPTGAIATRNPEELMEDFTLLTWVFRTLEDAEVTPDPRLIAALERTAPTLRNLRLGDGTLTRFHGGGRGPEGWLDQVLSDSRVRKSRAGELAMGYERLTAARITLLVDCAKPSDLAHSQHAHASTLAFEMSSSRYPMIVNSGAGQEFGPKWERACRMTEAHNTVTIDKVSSSRIAPRGLVSNTYGVRLLDTPTTVTRNRKNDQQGNWLLASHDGYVKSYGLTHQRRLYLSPDGREFRGQDSLNATTPAEQKQFTKANEFVRGTGPTYHAHFHLHPDVKSKLADDGKSVTLQLANNEIWVFRQEGGEITLADSVYLDQWRLKPRATKQVVVTSHVLEYGSRITWIFKRIDDGVRNTVHTRETTASE